MTNVPAKSKFLTINLKEDGIILLEVPAIVAKALFDIKYATDIKFIADEDFVEIQLEYNDGSKSKIVLPERDVELILY